MKLKYSFENVEIDGEILSSMTALQTKLATYNEGDVLSIKVFRDEGFAAQINNDRIDMTAIGEGEYIDLSLTLRIVDHLDM